LSCTSEANFFSFLSILLEKAKFCVFFLFSV
jgi:hypothetical protein